jgi:hypothetical protein
MFRLQVIMLDIMENASQFQITITMPTNFRQVNRDLSKINKFSLAFAPTSQT